MFNVSKPLIAVAKPTYQTIPALQVLMRNARHQESCVKIKQAPAGKNSRNTSRLGIMLSSIPGNESADKHGKV